MIGDEADQSPNRKDGILELVARAEGKDLYGREAQVQFLSIRWIDKKMIRERQKSGKLS